VTIALFLPYLVAVAASDPWADASPAVWYGEGAGFGQDYYPDNVLGPPDPGATATVPSCSETELLTLGAEGWIVLEFADNVVVDGPGVDFSVFENVMRTGSGYFRECAFVEVSADGENWTMFPWDPETLEGLAGVRPTTGKDPTNPEVSGGDGFDLSRVGLPWIAYVRLTDCGEAVKDGGLFDLDAVVAVNWKDAGGFAPGGVEFGPNPAVDVLDVTVWKPWNFRVYSVNGRLLLEGELRGGDGGIDVSRLPSGVYVMMLHDDENSSCRFLFTVAR